MFSKIRFFPVLARSLFLLWQDGKWTGYEIDLLTHFVQYLGRPVNLYVLDFASLIPALLSHKADIIAGAICRTEERAKQVCFSDCYMQAYTSVFQYDKDKDAGQNLFFWQKIVNGFKKNFYY